MKVIISGINIFLIVFASLAGGFMISAFVFTDAGARLSEEGMDMYSDMSAEVKQSVFLAGDFANNLFDSVGFGKLRDTKNSFDDKVVGAIKSIDVARSSGEDNSYIDLNNYDISDEKRVVVADLNDMTLSLIENGEEVKELPILSKGRPGSPWETPSGKYKVLYKEENHFSSIGKVYMPSSIQFFGNFFIHGWPYYPDGTPVSEGYSGGCIRLSAESAEEVFEFVENGTPVVVKSDKGKGQLAEARGQGRYVIDNVGSPALSAESYLVADLETGEVILEKARAEIRPIASVSKLMTALVSLEVVNQYQTAYITSDIIQTEGYAGGLYPGQQIETGDLLYPLLLESSNDAAEALAQHYGRSYFIEQMNNKAKSVGLENTFYEDPSGLSSENVSNAEDLFVLSQHIFKNKKHIFDVSLLDKYGNGSQTWKNISKFLDYEGYLGGKNGYTDEAGKTVVSLFSLPLAEFEDRKVAIILLNTSDIKRDVDKILNYLDRNVFYNQVTRQADSGEVNNTEI